MRAHIESLLHGCAAAALVVLAPRPAVALEEFPATLAQTLGMPCTPSCLPCHTSVPGAKTNQRADGLAAALLLQGGRVVDAADLEQRLEGMLEGTLMPPADSDGDGENDLVDLAAGDNPYGGPSLCDAPTYGCGARIAPSTPTRLGVLGFVAVGVALFVRRRHGRS